MFVVSVELQYVSRPLHELRKALLAWANDTPGNPRAQARATRTALALELAMAKALDQSMQVLKMRSLMERDQVGDPSL